MRSHFTTKIFRGSRHDPESRVRKGRPPRDLEDRASHVGMADAVRRGWDRKESRNVISYSFMKRWLRSRSGRRWNDVWAEICALCPGPEGMEVRDLFRSTVDLHTDREEDGTIFVHSRFGRYYRPSELYIDPEGILQFGGGYRRQRSGPRTNPDVRKLGGDRELHRIDGIWYEIGFTPLPPVVITPIYAEDGFRYSVKDPGAMDLLLRRVVHRREGWHNPAVAGRRDEERHTYASSKRSLNSDELRRHDLRNGDDGDAEAAA